MKELNQVFVNMKQNIKIQSGKKMKEWNQVFVETKQKIIIQSATRWKNEIKCSLRRSRRSKFNLGHIERMKSSVRKDKEEDQNSI